MKSHLCWLPIILTVITIVCFSTSYVMAVIRKDVNPFWPYISDTGTKVPESCVFGQLLNLTAFLAFSTMFVRFKLVQAFNNHDKLLRCLNTFSLVVGGFSSVGVSLVANFQESGVLPVHIIGAVMAFGLGVVYCFIHTAITRRMYPTYNGYFIWMIRLTISFVGLVSICTSGIFGLISFHEAGVFAKSKDYPLQWNSTDPGYDFHVGSTISEWIIGIAFLSFFLTYVNDFQKITMRILPELLVSHLDETPIVFTNSIATERTGLLA